MPVHTMQTLTFDLLQTDRNTIGSVPWCLLMARYLFRMGGPSRNVRKTSYFVQERP
jgi:hypothetical protein